MASTIAFNANSAHSLIITTSGDGGAVSATRADVLAACAEGPLKTLLTRTADWTVFNLSQAACGAIHVREIVQRQGGADAEVFEFFWTATGIKADCDSVLQLEIRLSHTSRY